MILASRTLAAALLAAAPVCLAGSASAAPLSAPLGLQNDAATQTLPVETVQWRGHWGGHGWGGRGWWGPGFAAGAIVGGAVAAATQPWGYDSGYYGYDYAPGYSSYGYDPGYTEYSYSPGYGGGGSIAYCEQRYRSYDPASGTYLGYDGFRHPCP